MRIYLLLIIIEIVFYELSVCFTTKVVKTICRTNFMSFLFIVQVGSVLRCKLLDSCERYIPNAKLNG